MDEEPDRRSEALHAIRSMVEATGKMPSPNKLEEYMCTVYKFLTMDDIYFTVDDNIVTLKRNDDTL